MVKRLLLILLCLLVAGCGSISVDLGGDFLILTSDGGPEDGGPEDGGLADGGPLEVVCPPDIVASVNETITLDGSQCCQGRSNLTYQWNLKRSPQASQENIQGATHQVAYFKVDKETTFRQPYIFKLCVNEIPYHSACCTVMAHTECCNALQAQLKWDVSNSDLDLHLLKYSESHPLDFFSIPDDCFHLNPGPEWGDAGEKDNPRLDINVTTGYGPENIAISAPYPGIYIIGVHYSCNFNWTGEEAPARAMVSLSCNGAITQWQNTLKLTGEFWAVAAVEWPGCLITPINRVYKVSQGCWPE